MMNDLSLIHHQLNLQVNSLEELLANDYDQVMTNQTQNYKRTLQNNVHTLEEKPLKQLKTNWNSTYEINHVLCSQDEDLNNNNSTMLSFSNNSSSSSNQTKSGLITPKKEVAIISNEMLVASHQQASTVDKQCSNIAHQVIPRSTNISCTTQLSRDHVIAERKRREKLNQKFIALSSIIPGLKKMDKASVLRDAAKYVKQLQEKVMELEVEAKKKAIISSIIVKRHYVSSEEDDQFYGGSSLGDGPFPEIEAKFVDKDVLIKIHCEKIKGIVENIASKIEELNLVVRSSSSLAFGGSTLAVTIVAQMDTEFSITAEEVARHIHASLKLWALIKQ